MAWNHRSVANKTRMFTFLHDIAKPLAEINKMHQQSCLTDKDHPEVTSCKPIYHGNPVICNFCSHSTKPAWRLQTKWYGKLCRSVAQGADEVGTESFVSVVFLISSEQYANICMAVLIRRVTCKSLFSFWGQRKVSSCEIHLRGLRPCFFHGGALVLFWTATKSATFLKNFQVNLHFTHYAQGKYVIERKFLYL